MSSRRIMAQGMYVIPRAKLHLFLTKLSIASSSFEYLTADYVFEKDENYFEVVVNAYSENTQIRFNYIWRDMEDFAKLLLENHKRDAKI